MQKNIILDFDGTLIDTERVMMRSVMEYAEMNGVPNDEEFMLKFVGVSPQYIAELLKDRFGADFDAVGFINGAVDYFNKTLVTRPTPLMDGAKELLEFLKNDGWYMGLATSTYRKIVDFELNHHDIAKYFDVVVCGNEVEHTKPSPEIYLKTAGLMGVLPKNCFALEDSTVGIESALSAGMKTVAIPDLHKISDENREKCFAVVKDRYDAIRLFRLLDEKE